MADHRPPALLRVNHMCVRPSQECGSRCLIVDGSLEKRSQNPAVRTFSSSCGPGDRGYDADLEILGRLLQTHLCVGVVYYIQIRKMCHTAKAESSEGIAKRLTRSRLRGKKHASLPMLGPCAQRQRYATACCAYRPTFIRCLSINPPPPPPSSVHCASFE